MEGTHKAIDSVRNKWKLINTIGLFDLIWVTGEERSGQIEGGGV